MRKFLLPLLGLLLPFGASAQTIQQSGSITPNHVVCWVSTGVVKDCGASSSGAANSLGFQTQSTQIIGMNNAAPAGAHNRLTFGITGSQAIIGINAFNGASELPLNLDIHGTTYAIPDGLVQGGLDDISTTQGVVLYRGSSDWEALSPGTNGQLLETQGAAANPRWVTAPGTGTVTSVDVSGGSTGLTTSGGPITSSGTITIAGTLALASGGTGANDASGARTALELGTAAVENTGTSGNNIPFLDGANTWSGSQTVAALTDIQQNVQASGDISPSQITAQQDDYSPTGLGTASTLRLTSDASQDMTGLAGGADGRLILIHNVGSNDIVLKDEDANSTAANRFAFDADATIGADQGVLLQYDSTSSRWRQVASVGSGGSTDVQTFDSSDTWTKPSSGTIAIIEAWGGGASGGAIATSTGSGGGGGGAYERVVLLLSALGATETVTIGAGGASVSSAASGNNGGNTTFGSHVTAYGGGASNGTNASAGGGGGALAQGGTPGGADGAAGGGPDGGAGGSTSAGGDSSFGGGGGGSSGEAGGDTAWGGGGAGGGATSGSAGAGGASVMGGGGGGGGATSGTVGAGGTSEGGGDGGSGGKNSVAATAGAQPGGGGGAAGGTGAGDASGAGGDGRVIVTVY